MGSEDKDGRKRNPYLRGMKKERQACYLGGGETPQPKKRRVRNSRKELRRGKKGQWERKGNRDCNTCAGRNEAREEERRWQKKRSAAKKR